MNNDKLLQNLYEVIALSDDPKEIQALLEDLCTVKELENMASRVYAAELLIEDKTYTEIIDETAISSATLSRISRCVQYNDGYQTFIGKDGLKNKNKQNK